MNKLKKYFQARKEARKKIKKSLKNFKYLKNQKKQLKMYYKNENKTLKEMIKSEKHNLKRKRKFFYANYFNFIGFIF